MPTKHIYGPARPSRLALMGIRFMVPPPDDPIVPVVTDPPAPVVTPNDVAPVVAPVAPVTAVVEPVEPEKVFDAEYVRTLREEAKANRIKAEQEAERANRAESERDDFKGKFTNLERTQSITLHAPTLGANTQLLLDSSSFQAEFAQVNLADPAAVTAAISEWIEKNPAYKSGPVVPGSSGGGAPHGGRSTTPPSGLAGAVAAAMTPTA